VSDTTLTLYTVNRVHDDDGRINDGDTAAVNLNHAFANNRNLHLHSFVAAVSKRTSRVLSRCYCSTTNEITVASSVADHTHAFRLFHCFQASLPAARTEFPFRGPGGHVLRGGGLIRPASGRDATAYV
jgi:hypothetical protein